MGDNGSMQVPLSNSSTGDSMAPDSIESIVTGLIESAIGTYSPAKNHAPADSGTFREDAAQAILWACSLTAFTGREPLAVTILGTGMRSVVLRVQYEAAGDAPSTMILKWYRRQDSAKNSGGFGYLRERHGLVALGELAPGVFPHLYGADDDLRCVALEDVAFADARAVGDALLPSTTQTPPGYLAFAVDSYLSVWNALAEAGVMPRAVERYRKALAKADRKAQHPGAMPSPALAENGLASLYPEADGLQVPEDVELEELGEQQQTLIEMAYRFRRVVQPFFTKRPPVPEQFTLNRGQVYMFSSGDFSPHNVLFGSARDTVRAFDAEGACIHHRGFPFVEAMLGFPSSPGYPNYEVNRERTVPRLFAALFGDTPLDTHLAEDLAVCAAVTACTLMELYSHGERAHLLGRIRRQSAELMMLLLRTGDSKDTALVDLAKRLGNVK